MEISFDEKHDRGRVIVKSLIFDDYLFDRMPAKCMEGLPTEGLSERLAFFME